MIERVIEIDCQTVKADVTRTGELWTAVAVHVHAIEEGVAARWATPEANIGKRAKKGSPVENRFRPGCSWECVLAANFPFDATKHEGDL